MKLVRANRGRVHYVPSDWRTTYDVETTRCGEPTRNMHEVSTTDATTPARCQHCYKSVAPAIALTHLPWEDRIDEDAMRRYWIRVALPDADGCMLWLGAIDNNGYGKVRIAGDSRKAHRVSLLLSVGKNPPGRDQAAHSCRNRHCVAPLHLRWASHLENSADMERDGTRRRGANSPAAKLTEAQVRDVRRRYATGLVLQRELAEEHGMTHSAINALLLGKTYRSVTDEAVA